MAKFDINEKNLGKILNSDVKKEKKSDDIFDIFNDINNQYNFDINDKGDFKEKELDLDRLEHKELSDEELENNAKNSLEDYYNSSKNNIIEKADSDKSALNESKDKWAETSEKAKESLDNEYSQRKDAANKDAINRGLARSSIIINKIEAFDKGKLEQYAQIDKQLTKELNDIDTQIQMLENAKEQSLKNFDISYATKLNEKINSLKSEQDKKREEVIKYNNEIEKKEKEFAASQSTAKKKYEDDLLKKKLELIEFSEKYGDDKLLEKKYLEKLQVARDYFKNKSKAEAIDILMNNGAFKVELGEKWYELYDEIRARKD